MKVLCNIEWPNVAYTKMIYASTSGSEFFYGLFVSLQSCGLLSAMTCKYLSRISVDLQSLWFCFIVKYQILVFGKSGKPEHSRKKTSRSRVRNQQAQHTSMARPDRARVTLLEPLCSGNQHKWYSDYKRQCFWNTSPKGLSIDIKEF